MSKMNNSMFVENLRVFDACEHDIPQGLESRFSDIVLESLRRHKDQPCISLWYSNVVGSNVGGADPKDKI